MEQFYLLVTSLLTTLLTRTTFSEIFQTGEKVQGYLITKGHLIESLNDTKRIKKHLFFYLNLIFLYYNVIINYYKFLLFLDSHFESHRYFSNI